MQVAALFPGQGFQKFGLLRGLARRYPALVDSYLADADDALPGLQLSRILVGSGPDVDVTPTELAQPVMLASGVITYRLWKQEIRSAHADVSFGLGHSLGEYAALTAAGLLPFKGALCLARARGEAMRDAGKQDSRDQGIMLVNKPRSYSAEKWPSLFAELARKAEVEVSLMNSPSLIGAGGVFPNLNTFVELLHEATGEKKLITKRLPVSSAFHSRLMAPAQEKLKSIIQEAPWQPFEAAEFPVVSNVTARPYTTLEEVKRGCVEGLTAPVRWSESVQFVDPQVKEFVALGAPIGSLMKAFVESQTTTVDASA